MDSSGEKAFLEIIGKHERIIHKICHAYGSDASAKQDLFQEIILQLWKSFSSFRNESKISTWIYRIALNTAFTHHRRSKSKVTLSFFGVFEEDKAEENEGGDYQENLTLLYAAIAKLSEIEKATLQATEKKKSRKHWVFRTIQRRDRDSNPGDGYPSTD